MNKITSKQFSEWQAYNEIDPIGEFRDDHRMAILASTIVNLLDGKKNGKAEPKDFIPDWEESTKKEASTEEMKEKVKRIAEVFGGKQDG